MICVLIDDSIYVDTWRHGRDGVYFNINVDPGPQYKVRNITWEGNTVYTDEQLTQTLVLKRVIFLTKLNFSKIWRSTRKNRM